MSRLNSIPAEKGDLALVTGATGFIGRHLVEVLRQQGFRVRVYSRQNYADVDDPGVDASSWFVGAVDDAEALNKACENVDVVFHLANIAHVNSPARDVIWRVNVEGSRAVCDACVRAGVSRLVYFSSSLAADPASSAYAESKRAAEEEVLAASDSPAGKLHVTVLRPVNVYGAGMKGNIAGLMRRIRQGRIPPLPRLHNRLALVSVKDLCRAAIAAARGRQASGKIYLISDGEAYTPNRIEAATYAALGRKSPAWHSPRVIFYAAAVAAQLANTLGIWRNDLGLRTYRNLVADQAAGAAEKETGVTADLAFKPAQTLESALPEILQALD